MVWGIVVGAVGVLLLFNLWWNKLRVYPPSKILARPGAKFPEGFLWGSGEDPYQHEGSSYNNDWHAWERQDPPPVDFGDKLEEGTDFWNRWREDFALAAKDGHTSHRIGVEWSRIEPEKGVYDEEALAKYEEMLRVMKEEHGFVTFLNLWHFTIPLWADEMGAWENPEFMERWEAFVEVCAKRFAKYVDYWSTMIDSQLYPLAGFMLGEIPPSIKDQKRAIKVYRTMIKAHARAYKVIKAHAKREDDPSYDAPVGQIYFFFNFHRRGFLIDVVIKRLFANIFNWGLLDGITKGKIDLFIPPFDRIKEDAPDCANTLDWIGVNYFTRAVSSFSLFAPGFISQKRQTRWITSDMDWEIYPEGIYETCKRVQARYPGIPQFITECGLADKDDSRRPRFLVEHISWVHKALEEGVDVRGFAHWSMTDNWEWARGSWPRFGMYSVDYETKERTETESARIFAKIAKANALPEELPPPLEMLQPFSRLPENPDEVPMTPV
jgi:beta-glucosidase